MCCWHDRLPQFTQVNGPKLPHVGQAQPFASMQARQTNRSTPKLGSEDTQCSQKSTVPHSVHLNDCRSLTALPQRGQWCVLASLTTVPSAGRTNSDTNPQCWQLYSLGFAVGTVGPPHLRQRIATIDIQFNSCQSESARRTAQLTRVEGT